MGHSFLPNRPTIQSNFPKKRGEVRNSRLGITGLIARQRGVMVLALALAGLSMNSCVGVREAERVTPHAISRIDPTWSFMSEPQRKSAEYILSIPCDEIERAIRNSRAAEIPVHFEMIQCIVDIQKALRRGDPKAISEKVRSFYSAAEKMEEGDVAIKFRELADNPDTAFEVKMVQDYMVPAYQGALMLTQFEAK